MWSQEYSGYNVVCNTLVVNPNLTLNLLFTHAYAAIEMKTYRHEDNQGQPLPPLPLHTHLLSFYRGRLLRIAAFGRESGCGSTWHWQLSLRGASMP